MKKMKKMWVFVLMFCCMVTFMPDTTVMAATTNPIGVETGVAYKSGRYIYYAYEMDGVRTDLIRFDTKTKKKKSIVSYKYNGQSTNGFYNISVKGKYIYAVWDLNMGTDTAYECIYRFSKDGKSKKRLAIGCDLVIIGNRIYYEKEKKVLDYTSSTGKKYYETVRTGKLYSMKLDGTDKKKEGSTSNLTLKLRNAYSDYNKTVTVGKYYYYIGNGGKTIYRKNTKTGKTNKVITFGECVSSYMVLDGYVMAKGLGKKEYIKKYGVSLSKFVTYCVKADGGSKTKLKSWIPAE
jgi:hypothetical protein